VKRYALALLLCLCATAAGAAPQRIHATYDMKKGGQQFAVVTETYTQTGKTYRIESDTKGIGIFALFDKGGIKLVSSGEVTRDGLRPLHFEHHRGSDPARLVVADFDWDNNVLTLKYDGRTETAKLEPGTQDRLSLMYQFMFMPHKTRDMVFHMTNGRSLERYQYNAAGEEQLDLPAGKFKTLHYSRQHQSDEDGTEVWLASAKDYFPVRVVIEEKKGGRLEQTLTQLSFE